MCQVKAKFIVCKYIFLASKTNSINIGERKKDLDIDRNVEWSQVLT